MAFGGRAWSEEPREHGDRSPGDAAPREVNIEVAEDAPVHSRVSAARPGQTSRLAMGRDCRRSCQPSDGRVRRGATTPKSTVIAAGLQGRLRCEEAIPE